MWKWNTRMDRKNDFRNLINLLYLTYASNCGWLTLPHRSLSGVNNRRPSFNPAPLISQADPSLCASHGIKCLCACAMSWRQPGCSLCRITLEPPFAKSHTVVKAVWNNLLRGLCLEDFKWLWAGRRHRNAYTGLQRWRLLHSNNSGNNHMYIIAADPHCNMLSLV